MTKTIFMIATALSASLALAPAPVQAAAADETGTVKPALTGQEIVRHSKAKSDILKALFEAQMSLQLGAKTDAERQINKAFSALEKARADGVADDSADTVPVMRVAEIKYGGMLLPDTVYVPLEGDDMTVESLAKSLTIKGIERGDVEDAEVRYMRLHILPDRLNHDLNEARADLTDDDLDGAKAQVRNAQKGMIYAYVDTVPAETRARDHITLTRFMLQANEYEGAREALDVAETALVDLNGDKDAVGRDAPAVEKIRTEADVLAELIARRDPTLAEQIDRKLAEWWQSAS